MPDFTWPAAEDDVRGKPQRKRPRPSSVLQLLSLIAHLEKCGEDGASVAELARVFGVSEDQILADVDMLWCTGTPGYQPQDLIDFDAIAYDSGIIRLRESQGATSTLRLSHTEGVLLSVGVRALLEDLGGILTDQVRELLENVDAQLNLGLENSNPALQLAFLSGHDSPIGAQLRQARDEQLQLQVVYVSASGERTERVLNPIQLILEEPHLYVRASTADAPQVFKNYRADRIQAATVLETAQNVTEEEPIQGAILSAAFKAGRGEVSSLQISPEARWLVEHLPGVDLEPQANGTLNVTLQVLDQHWFTRLLLSIGRHLVGTTSVCALRHAANLAEQALDNYGNLAEEMQ